MNILHFTDFHINKKNHGEFEKLCLNINDSIQDLGKENNPQIVLVTGDITDKGNQDEYKWFREGFEKLLAMSAFKKVEYVMILPGNHDFPWDVEETREQNFRFLCSNLEKGLSSLENLNEQKKLNDNLIKHIFIEGEDKNILLIGMNSMKIDSKDRPGIGYFEKEQLRLVSHIVDVYRQSDKKLQIFVAFHHHLLPVSVVESETLKDADKYSITLDARRALNTFLDQKIEFAVHGHQHQPSMVTWKDDERDEDNVLHVISAGCMAGKDYAGEGARNSFMLYSVEVNKVVVNKAESSNRDSEEYKWSSVTYFDGEKVEHILKKYTTDNFERKINRERILKLAEQDDQWIKCAEVLGDLTIKGLVEKMVNCIADDGSVAYEVNTKKRYRTSTLATVLECMDDISLLPEEDLLIMQTKLFKLKDEFTPLDASDDVISKDDEDSAAWGIDEAPSVWTTSKALITLFTTKYKPISLDEEKELALSIEWLAEQQYENGGWGYQKYESIAACTSSVPMTALAMKALSLSLTYPYISEKVDVRKIKKTLVIGLGYLKKEKKEEKGKKCAWEYEGKTNLSATIWALEAWKLASEVTENKHYQSVYKKIKPLTLQYVVNNLPGKDEDDNWTECFFKAKKEDGLKYKKGPLKKDKAFYSFTPYIISYIIKEDKKYVENPKVLSVIKWVVAHRDDVWLIEKNYNSENACVISVAMAINVIVNWLKAKANTLLEKEIELIFY